MFAKIVDMSGHIIQRPARAVDHLTSQQRNQIKLRRNPLKTKRDHRSGNYVSHNPRSTRYCDNRI